MKYVAKIETRFGMVENLEDNLLRGFMIAWRNQERWKKSQYDSKVFSILTGHKFIAAAAWYFLIGIIPQFFYFLIYFV